MKGVTEMLKGNAIFVGLMRIRTNRSGVTSKGPTGTVRKTVLASGGFEGLHCAFKPLSCEPHLGRCLQEESNSAVFGGSLTHFASFIQREPGAADFVTKPHSGVTFDYIIKVHVSYCILHVYYYALQGR